MSLRTTIAKAFASQAEIEADEERAEARLQVGCTAVAALPDRSRATVTGVLRTVTLRPRQGVPALEAELYDGSGSINVVWLGRRRIGGIVPGRAIRVEGRIGVQDGVRMMYNPRYDLRPM